MQLGDLPKAKEVSEVAKDLGDAEANK